MKRQQYEGSHDPQKYWKYKHQTKNELIDPNATRIRRTQKRTESDKIGIEQVKRIGGDLEPSLWRKQ